MSNRSLVSCALALSAFALLWSPPAARAAGERLVLLPVSGTNIHTGYLDAARDIMKDHLLGTGRYTVVMAPGASGTVEATPEEAVQRGREAGAELAVVVHFTRLSGSGRLRLSAYRTGSGAPTHTDSIAVAGGPDDLDPALKRLAVGLATGRPAAETADLESVTQKQADPLLKETATKIFGLRLGAIMAFNRPADLDSATLPGLGIFWMYDARSFLGEVGLDLHRVDDNAGFSISIGGYFPFSRNNLTPYLGSSVAYSFVDLGGEGASGLRLAPAFGLLFGRLSTVQFRGELGYFFNTFGERPELARVNGVAVQGERRHAHGPQFAVGLGF